MQPERDFSIVKSLLGDKRGKSGSTTFFVEKSFPFQKVDMENQLFVHVAHICNEIDIHL